MSKRSFPGPATGSAGTAATPSPAPTNWLSPDKLIPLFFCLAYLVVHFIPDMGAYDAMAPQWLFFLGVDFVAVIFILAKKARYEAAIQAIFSNRFSKLYLAFFALAGVSALWAINPTETWICYVRLIATVIGFFCLAIVLYDRIGNIFNVLAQLIALICLVEVLIAFSNFFGEIGQIPANELLLNIKNTTGNKNIFAAATITKLPFVLYCIHTGAVWKKILNITTLFLAALILFIANARASYLSLFLIALLYLIFCVLEYRKGKKTEQLMFRFGYMIIPLMAALFISQIEIAHIRELDTQKGSYGTVGERLKTITDFSDVRIQLWGHAIDYTKKHPFTGSGYGNWKVASIPYVRVLTNDLFVPVHSHNDFLEMFGELGILGGLLYLSLFLCIVVFTYKTFFSSTVPDEAKLVSLFSFMGFTGYTVDAFFNFPMERPVSQVFFVLLTAINMVIYLQYRNKEEEKPRSSSSLLLPAFGLISLMIIIPAAYVMYYNYKSLVIQRRIIPDLNFEPMQLKMDEIFPLIPSIPNISANAQPLDAIKGRYLSEARRYDEALALLNSSIAANPKIGYSEFLKAGIFFNTQKWDSASVNALAAFDYRPRAKTYYQTLMAVLSVTRDSTNIQRCFEEYTKYRDQPFAYDMYIRAMLRAQGKGTQFLLDTVDHALKKFPGDTSLVTRRVEIISLMGGANNAAATNAALVAQAQAYYSDAVTAFAKGQAGDKEQYRKAAVGFAKAGQIITNNYVIYENAGIAYFNLGEFATSINYFDKAIALGPADGKSYYFKGVAQYNTGKTAEGCNTMRIAAGRGYKEAETILKANCK